MELKIYADRMSQPCRAVIIFCKMNEIPFSEVKVDLVKGEQRSNQFREINPMGKVPAIVDGCFKLYESHAILIYLSSIFPGIPDSWYPADPFKRAKIHAVLQWHNGNLRIGVAPLVLHRVLAPLFDRPLNPQAAARAEKILASSLKELESIWLKQNDRFLLGAMKPSVADLSLACEIMQLELLNENDHGRILGTHKRVLDWVENVKHETSPHFEEVHSVLYRAKTRLHKHQSKL